MYSQGLSGKSQDFWEHAYQNTFEWTDVFFLNSEKSTNAEQEKNKTDSGFWEQRP